MVVKPYQWLAWVSNSMFTDSGYTMPAFNVYPLYIWAFIIASNSLWILVGVLWNEKSLIVL